MAFGQKPEYDFYSEFRTWMQQSRGQDPTLTRARMLEQYTAKLKREAVAEAEIARRLNLIITSRDALEDDFWNRFFTEGKAAFNTAPNSFLTEVVEGRNPGAALDVGMGQGRNAIFLAKLGWQSYGFDPAAEAVALGQKRAKALGLTIHTATVRDSEYEFGKNRFDLVLFSWVPPNPESARKVVDSLKPDGVVVMEFGADWLGRNEALKMFDSLQVVRYQIVNAKSDFFNRREMEILRMVARKVGK